MSLAIIAEKINTTHSIHNYRPGWNEKINKTRKIVLSTDTMIILKTPVKWLSTEHIKEILFGESSSLALTPKNVSEQYGLYIK